MEKPRKPLTEARIIEYAGTFCLYEKRENNKALRTSPLLRADFVSMEFETQNTIYIVQKLLTS